MRLAPSPRKWHEIASQYLFAWRKAARRGRLVRPADATPRLRVCAGRDGGAGADAVAQGQPVRVIEIAGWWLRAKPGNIRTLP
jgi:hypothetical protein